MEKISRDNQVSPAQARKMIEKEDKRRENFFRYYTGRRWKDLSNYHLCLDSGILGLDKTVQMILDYLAKLPDATD